MKQKWCNSKKGISSNTVEQQAVIIVLHWNNLLASLSANQLIISFHFFYSFIEKFFISSTPEYNFLQLNEEFLDSNNIPDSTHFSS